MRAPRLPAGSRASGGTAIERQLPGTRPAQSVQGTCPPAWGPRAQEGPGKGSFLKPQSFPEMPRDSCQVSRPEGEQGCTFPSLFSVQKISDVPDIEDLHLIEQPALGMLTISIFPLCLLPGDYVRQVIQGKDSLHITLPIVYEPYNSIYTSFSISPLQAWPLCYFEIYATSILLIIPIIHYYFYL